MPNISVLTYALISEDIYRRIGMSPRLKARGWKKLEVPKEPRINDPFFARLYYNERHFNEFVIAYRGTVLDINKYGKEAVAGDAEADAEIFADTHLPNAWKLSPTIFKRALQFYFDARKIAAKKQNFSIPRIKITGHSLGGALASYVAVKTKAIAVVFNAPGIAQLPDVPKNKYPNIHNFNAKGGYINKVGDSYGDEHVVRVSDNAAECQEPKWHLIDQWNCAMGQHEITHMVANLGKELSIAGKGF